MVVENDDWAEGLTYEQMLSSVCGSDKFPETYKKCMELIEKIPIGWSDK